MMARKMVRAVSVSVVLAASTGCAVNTLEKDFGNSVRAMRAAQAIPPDKEGGESALDGVKAMGAIKAYRKAPGDAPGAAPGAYGSDMSTR